MDTLLTENWSETKDILLDGLKPQMKEIVSPLLENQRRSMLTESAAAGALSATDIANYRRTLLPMIRRIIPGTIGPEIVGVQAMSGPVDLVYTLRYTYGEDMDHNPDNSPFGGYDIKKGDEAFGNEKLIRQFYSGGVSDPASPYAPLDADPGASGISWDSSVPGIPDELAHGQGWNSDADMDPAVDGYTVGNDLYGDPVGGSLYGGSGQYLEGSGGRKMSLEIINQTVTARTRKLQAGWTIEAMQDAQSQHGVDPESELTKALSAEIVQEIDAEIITDLIKLAGTVRDFDFDETGHAGSSGNYAPTHVGDRFANIGVRINEVANVIGRKTRRGSGNFIVVSPMMVSVLQSAARSVFSPQVKGDFKGPNNTELVGTLNGSIKVYSYLWNDASPVNPQSPTGTGTDTILVGYKGGNGEVDCGYWYAPYIPLMSTGVIMNPVTHQPVMSLMTRYGKVALTDPAVSLGNSADYYGKIRVLNLDFI